MDLGLRDKIALVTGGSSGIGAATAVLLAVEGADVVVCYGQNVAGATEVAETIRGLGRRAWVEAIDLRDHEQVVSAMVRIGATVSGLDALILCAGENIVTQFADLTPQEWTAIIDVNLNGPFYLLHAATSFLRAGAAVVTVASVAAHTGAPHHAHYAAAKAGLLNLTKSAARALGPRVRVNCVAPGITLTAMGHDTVAALAPDYAESKLLLQRFAEPEEVARVIVFLASPAASFITGATLDVNGGRELR